MKQLQATMARLRKEIDAEAAMLQEQATEGATPLAPPAGSMTGRATTGRNPGVITSLSEADLRAQVDSLSAELEVLQRLPDAADRGRFLVSRHPELTTDNFRGEVGSWSAIPKSSRTNDSWLHFESQVRNLIRPLEDRLQFARMELEVLQKQKAEREPWHVSIFGYVSRPGDITVEQGQKLTVSQAVRMCGGPTENADLRKVFVRRKTKDGTEEKIPVNIDRILNQGDTSADVLLIEGDKVVVPERNLKF
jgi:hypothetical protein